jgi:hypothetical protein
VPRPLKTIIAGATQIALRATALKIGARIYIDMLGGWCGGGRKSGAGEAFHVV